MEKQLSTGWMKLALRAQICARCDPQPTEPVSWEPHSCESGCALFGQLPRLARFLKRHHGKPPGGYEEFAINLLRESSKVDTRPDAFLEYAYDTLATLENVSALTEPAAVKAPEHNCIRQDLALGQLSVHAEQRFQP